MIPYFSLGILLLLWGAPLYKRRSLSIDTIAKYFFIFSIIAIFLWLIWLSYEQDQIWSKSNITKLLLPPYNQTYFWFYVLGRFFAPYIASFAAAIIFIKLAKFYNKKYGEIFFYPEELYWGATALFLSSHPGWLLYLIVFFVAYLTVQLIYNFILGIRGERVSFYHLWLPAAIFVIILQIWLSKFFFWRLFTI